MEVLCAIYTILSKCLSQLLRTGMGSLSPSRWLLEIFKDLMGTHSHAAKLLAGSSAGATAVLLTYPLDTIRARLAFQITGGEMYTGIVHAATSIFKELGNGPDAGADIQRTRSTQGALQRHEHQLSTSDANGRRLVFDLRADEASFTAGHRAQTVD
ncbi:unnamed protein product [Nesidiocoris tenuis]|uniref:Uncharacterized protein n=1 Tax=Nesidiocoris tenuis TaxID=355587 RepID=A0A6H5HSW7_9HEMI|nr:unnamed protein product [Nesidiocoris tenuis]